MRKIGTFLAFLLIAILVLFIVQNLQAVELRFLGWQWNMSLSVPIFGAYVLGGLTARPVWRFLNSQRRLRREEKKSAKKASEEAMGSEKQTSPMGKSTLQEQPDTPSIEES